MKIGYARVSTDRQDLTAQINELVSLGVDEKNIYSDPGFTGTNRQRPGLDQALAAASHPGAEFVVTKLDRLARSIRDAKDIADALVANGAVLQIGRSAYDPSDAMGKMMFNIMATFAEFEADLIRQRTKEGMALAKARGRLKGKRPKFRRTRRSAWSSCTPRVIIRSPSWRRTSASPAPPCTGPSKETVNGGPPRE